MERLKELYQYAPDCIRSKYPFLIDYKIKNIFITGDKPKNSKDGPWSRLEKFCKENDIELIEEVAKVIKKGQKIVAFTGAGMSA